MFVDTNIRSLKRSGLANLCRLAPLHQPCSGPPTLLPGPLWPCQDPFGQLSNSFLPSVTYTILRSFPPSFLHVYFVLSHLVLPTSSYSFFLFILFSLCFFSFVFTVSLQLWGRRWSLRGLRTARPHYRVFPLTFFSPYFPRGKIRGRREAVVPPSPGRKWGSKSPINIS